MNIIALVILTLSLLLVNADQYCDNLYKRYVDDCVTIKNCCELRKVLPNRATSGVYKMTTKAVGIYTTTDVYCDMVTDGGGWIVIQRNRNSSLLNFNRFWKSYEEGFGDLNGDFLAGLKLMHILTQTGQWELRIDIQKADGTWVYIPYNRFAVGSASQEYQLTVGEFTGKKYNLFSIHNGLRFSTTDNDNDNAKGNCARYEGSGWWYHFCHHINLNQIPFKYAARGAIGPVRFVEMKIRRRDFCVAR